MLLGRYNVQRIHKSDLDKNKMYGDIVREKFGSLSAVFSFVPETMEALYRHEGRYPSRGEFLTLKTYRESRKHWYKSTGVIIL